VKNDTSSSHQAKASAKAKAPLQLGGRLWKCLMGLILIAVGSAFVQYLWHAYTRAAKMDDWVEVPCEIVKMDVDDEQLNQRGMTKYIFEVAYTYEFEGNTYTGSRLKRLPTEVSDPRKLKHHIKDYAVGAKTICYLDPDAPETVVLKKDSKAALYTIWFPCLFIVGGAGMIVSALFRRSA